MNEIFHFQNVKYFIHSTEWRSSQINDTSLAAARRLKVDQPGSSSVSSVAGSLTTNQRSVLGAGWRQLSAATATATLTAPCGTLSKDAGTNVIGTAQHYLTLLKVFLFLNIWFQQDGAMSHYTMDVLAFLQKDSKLKQFPTGAILIWLPKSPDISPAQFLPAGTAQRDTLSNKTQNGRTRSRRYQRNFSHPLSNAKMSCW